MQKDVWNIDLDFGFIAHIKLTLITHEHYYSLDISVFLFLSFEYKCTWVTAAMSQQSYFCLKGKSVPLISIQWYLYKVFNNFIMKRLYRNPYAGLVTGRYAIQTFRWK